MPLPPYLPSTENKMKNKMIPDRNKIIPAAIRETLCHDTILLSTHTMMSLLWQVKQTNSKREHVENSPVSSEAIRCTSGFLKTLVWGCWHNEWFYPLGFGLEELWFLTGIFFLTSASFVIFTNCLCILYGFLDFCIFPGGGCISCSMVVEIIWSVVLWLDVFWWWSSSRMLWWILSDCCISCWSSMMRCYNFGGFLWWAFATLVSVDFVDFAMEMVDDCACAMAVRPKTRGHAFLAC